MKIGLMLLLFIMCINISVFMLEDAMGLTPLQSFNTTEENKFNATGVVDAWDWNTDNFIGDVGAGLNFLWNGIRPFTAGTGVLLVEMGLTERLSSALTYVYSFVLLIMVAEIIMGRQLSGV